MQITIKDSHYYEKTRAGQEGEKLRLNRLPEITLDEENVFRIVKKYCFEGFDDSIVRESVKEGFEKLNNGTLVLEWILQDLQIDKNELSNVIRDVRKEQAQEGFERACKES